MEPVCEAERELRLTVPSPSKIHFTAQVFSEEVRGSFLAHVLRGLTSSGALSISIEGYRIMGKVDLRGVSGISDLKLLNNTFDDDLDLSESSLGSLTIEHCSLYTLDATQIRVGHDLTIISSEIVGAKSLPLGLSVVVSPHDVGRMSTCAVSLRLAQVKGDFGIEGSQFGAKSTAEDGALPQPLYRAAYALAARQLSVSGAVNVSGSLFYGRVDLANAAIDGEVAFAASTLSATSLTRSGGLIPDTALQLGGSRLGSSLWFVQGRDDEQQGVAVHGALRIPGVRIAGILQLTGLECFGTDISAFDARNARIDGSVYTNGTNTIFGPVRFEAANVGGEFDARNLTVVAHQESIQFSGITVGRALRFSEPFRCIGPVNLSGAKVGGDIDLSGARLGHLSPPRQREAELALNIDGAEVGGSVKLERTWVSGWSTTVRAKVGDHVRLSNARLRTTTSENAKHALGPVLVLDGIEIGGDLDMDGLDVEGEIRMADGAVRGSLPLHEALLWNEGGDALALFGTTILGSLAFHPRAVVGRVRLDGLTVDAIVDNPVRWPSRISLGGLKFNRFGPDHEHRRWDCVGRIDLLKRQDPFELGPYETFAAVFRSHGLFDDADRIVMAGRREARVRKARAQRPAKDSQQPHETIEAPRRYDERVGIRRWSRRAISFLDDYMLGFGRRPGRVVYPLIALVVGLTIFLSLPGANQAFRASDATGRIYRPLHSATGLSEMCGDGAVRCFSPTLLAIDTMVPLVDLGQRSTWHPHRHSPYGTAYEVGLAIATILGWILSSVAVVGFARAAQGD